MLTLIQKFRTVNVKNRIIKRGALTAHFVYNGKKFRITNVHLAWEGGFKHTLNQLSYIQKELSTNPVDYEIILGDFNTYTPFRSLSKRRKIIENVLGNGLKDVFFDLPWSCDISYVSNHDKLAPFLRLLRKFKINLRFRFDYIFAKNLKTTYKEMLDLPGSDHRPLVCNLEF